MIRPCNFGYNSETSFTNVFQKNSFLSHPEIHHRALSEFDHFAGMLHDNKITVEIFEDTLAPATPDSIFPNNWFSSHPDGLLLIYPMLALSRRDEKRKDIIEFLQKKYPHGNLVDLSGYEKENIFLEGTGSLVLDHKNKVGYANISSRTNKKLAEKVCGMSGYKSCIFSASDAHENEIYHTNVMLSIGEGFAIACLDSIKRPAERMYVKKSLEESGLEIIEISFEQMNSFCGNALELQNSDGNNILVMSENAFKAFSEKQLKTLEKYADIIYSPLHTIEIAGGGSARCMMAEIF